MKPPAPRHLSWNTGRSGTILSQGPPEFNSGKALGFLFSFDGGFFGMV